MGTSYSIVVELPEKQKVDVDFLKKEIQEIFKFINFSYSLYLKESRITQLNHNQTTYLTRKEIELYQIAQELCNKTNAYFFPFKKEILSIVEQKKIQLRNICNAFTIIKVEEEHYIIKKKYPWIQFDFNAIAKGYAVDLVKKFLESKNLRKYLIEIGGEICLGDAPSGTLGWKVALESPSSDLSHKQIASVRILKNICMASSGNYLQVHIFDPYRKEYPKKNQIVIVYGPSCTLADAYATYIYVQSNFGFDSEEYKVEILKESY
ncbi:MAG: FAD:protein FMN transferase [Leptonema sp. (in: bacteria)]